MLSRIVRTVQPSATRALSSTTAASMSSDASFVRGLFQGQLDTRALIPFPQALDGEQREMVAMLVDATARFLGEENDPNANDQAAEVPEHVLDGLREMGMWGLQVPEEYNGLALNNTQYARMVEVVGGSGASEANGVGGNGDLGLGIYIGAHQSIGYKGIVLFGTDEQKQQYLPKLATGEETAAFVLTEPGTGSDANSVKTRATWDEDAGVWRLSGSKLWISNGDRAEVMTVFAQTEVTDPKTGDKRDKMTAFIVERAFGGVDNGPKEDKLGIRASPTAEVYFDNTPVPPENVLGEVGKGFYVCMEILNNGRFGMGAALTGAMKQTIAMCVDQASQREQFGSKISEYQLVKDRLARMAMRCYAAESLAYAVAGSMDAGASDYQLEAAVSKIYASEAAWEVQDSAIQLFGGNGFMTNTLSRTMRDLRIFRIFEGENNILRLFLALTASQSAGKALADVAKNPMANLGSVAAALQRRVGMGGGATFEGAHADLRPAAQLIEGCATEFTAAVETLLMTHKKAILNEQLQVRRLAECTIELYASACCVARATSAIESGSPTAAHETLLANTYVADAAEKINQELRLIKSTPADAGVAQLADEMLERGAYVPRHVVGG